MKKIDLLLEIYKLQIKTLCSLENIAKYSEKEYQSDANENILKHEEDIEQTEQDIFDLFESLIPTMSYADKKEEIGINQLENSRQDFEV